MSKRSRSAVTPRVQPDQPTHSWLWSLTALLTGAVVMSLEIASVRLFAPYFGQSVYVWGNVIGVFMTAMALGYVIGGRVADRATNDVRLFQAIFLAGLYQVAALLSAFPILRLCAGWSDLPGTSLATLILFGPPLFVLAAATPYLIRLQAETGHLGRSAGSLSALATCGGILGVWATTFVLLPWLGTRSTLTADAACCLLLGGLGCWRRSWRAWGAPVAVAAAVFAGGGNATDIANTVYVAESPYNLVIVRDIGRLRTLALNQPLGYHTVHDPSGGWSGSYYDDFAIGPLLVPTRRALVLGMGAGESIHALWRTAPDATVDAVEIDPEVVAVARRFFGMVPDEGRLRVHVADARRWLAKSNQQFDLIQADLFHGGAYIPFHLATQEFYQQVADHLQDNGLLMVNVLDVAPFLELLSSMTATLQSVFPTVLVYSRPEGNHLLLALKRSANREDLSNELTAGPADGGGSGRLKPAPTSELWRLVQRVGKGLRQAPPAARQGVMVLRDDRAPIEALTRQMLQQLRMRQ